MVLIVTVLPFPAASLIWTGYMECIQLSSGSFVGEELRKWKTPRMYSSHIQLRTVYLPLSYIYARGALNSGPLSNEGLCVHACLVPPNVSGTKRFRRRLCNIAYYKWPSQDGSKSRSPDVPNPRNVVRLASYYVCIRI